MTFVVASEEEQRHDESRASLQGTQRDAGIASPSSDKRKRKRKGGIKPVFKIAPSIFVRRLCRRAWSHLQCTKRERRRAVREADLKRGRKAAECEEVGGGGGWRQLARLAEEARLFLRSL